MLRLLLVWLINAVALLAVAYLMPSISISSFGAALVAALVLGLVNAVIRSGSNAVHGSGYEFLRNDILDASNFFANRTGLAKPLRRRNQFGGTLGGPVAKERRELGHGLLTYALLLEGLNPAYADRAPLLEPRSRLKASGMGLLSPTVLIDGRVICTWKRVIAGRRVQVATRLARKLTAPESAALHAVIADYARFIALDAK